MIDANKYKKLFKIILEYWNYTMGSLIMLSSLILLSFGKIDKETFYMIFGAIATIGWLPNKRKEQKNDS
jgi:hypothetical protein